MITGKQIRAARGLLNWTREELAKASGLSPNGIAKVESDAGHPLAITLEKIERALAAEGVVFTNGDEPGVKQRKAP